MKKICFLLVLCILLCSCSSVKDDIPVQILAASLGEEIDGFENMAEASTDYIKYCMNSDLSLYSEYIVLYPFAGTVYNEFGIFKVKDKANLDKGIEEVNNYLAFKKSNWDTRYKSEELNKIEKAKTVNIGRYILYVILGSEDSAEVIEKFKEELK
ncbi:MAG: DUF4358 domain-containing protein [Clostridia bacterium]|nr:DUF4358 domain-containing protein [Clostridia bacterium]